MTAGASLKASKLLCSHIVFLPYLILAALTSLPAFAKYTARPLTITLGYAVGLAAVAWFLRRSGFERRNRVPASLWLVLCGGLALGNAILYPTTRDPAAHSTAPDALIEPAERLLAGVHPYAKAMYDGAPASPGPAWIAVHAPITVSGVIWLLAPIHVAWAAFMVSRISHVSATPFVVLVLALPAFLQMSVVGHDLFAVGCAMVAVTLGAYRQTESPSRTWVFWSVAAGVVSTARAPLLVFPAALTMLAVRSNPRLGVRFGALAAGVALVTHATVYVWGYSLGLCYQPFHVFDRAAGGAGNPAMTSGAIIVLVVSTVLWLRGTDSAARWLFFVWATTGLPFVVVGLGERVTLDHLGWSGWEGKVYAGFGLSLLAAAALLSTKSSDRFELT